MGGNGGYNKNLRKSASLLVLLFVFVSFLTPQYALAGDGFFRGVFCSVITLFGNSCDVDFSGISVNPKKPAVPEVKSEHITQELPAGSEHGENVTNIYNFYPVTVVSKPAAVQDPMAGADEYTDSYTKEWTPLVLFYKQVDKIYDLLGDRVDDSIDDLEEELSDAFSTLSLTLTGALYDNNNSAGSNGNVLISTGSGVTWVATSTLGITGGGGGLASTDIDTSAEVASIVTDETGSGRLVFSSSPAFSGTATFSALTATSTFTMSGTSANIALGSNYLSGDGGDEGVFVSSAGNVSIGSSSPTAKLEVLQTNGDTESDGFKIARTNNASGRIYMNSGNDFVLQRATHTNQLVLDNSGNVGIGTSTPLQELTVSGDLRLTGAIYDSNNSAGTSGYVLQSTATGQRWVATSTLGFGTGNLSSADIDTSSELLAILTDETGTGNSVFSASPTFTGTVNAAAGTFSSTLTAPTFNASGASSTLLSLNGTPLLTASDSQASIGVGSYMNALGGDGNSAFGYYALNVNTTGSYNTAIGQCAQCSNTTGSGNTAIGNEAMNNNTTGNYNVALGDGALYYNATGTSNIGIGYRGAEGITGSYNIGIGELSLWSAYVTSNQRNIAIGYQAGIDLEDGSDNIFIGYNAGDNLWTGSNNIIIGRNIAAPVNDGSGQLNIGNLLFGTDLDNTGTTISSGNIGIGTSSPSQKLTVAGTGLFTDTLTAPTFNATGASTTILSIDNISFFRASTTNTSIFIGENAGTAVTSDGPGNTGFGHQALKAVTEGASNTAVGLNSLLSNVTGSMNTAFGASTLVSNVGSFNNAFGAQALQSNTVGSYNNAFGDAALFANTSGSRNIALGKWTLVSNNGTGTIAIGYQAGDNLTSGDRNILIGYDIDAPTAISDNILNIGNLLFGTGIDGTGTTLSSGNIGIGTTSPASKLTVSGGDILIDNGEYYQAKRNTSGTAINVLGFEAGTDNLYLRTGGASISNRFSIVNTGGTQMFTILNSGLVGVGTSTPSEMLSVVGSASSVRSRLQNTLSTGYAEFVAHNNAGNKLVSMGVYGSAASAYGVLSANEGYLYNDSANLNIVADSSGGTSNIVFATGATAGETMRLTGAGRLGIGTTTPNQKLSIFANAADAAIELSTVSGANEKWTIGIDDSDGAKFKISSSSALGTNDRFVIDGTGNVGIGTSTLSATGCNGKLCVSGGVLNLDNTQAIAWGGGTGRASIAGDKSAGTMTFNAAASYAFNTGSVGIGTTTPQAKLHIQSSANQHKLYVSGYGNTLGNGAVFRPANDSASPLVFHNSSGSTVGSVATDAVSTTYNTTSDKRVKTGIEDTSLGLATLMELPVRDFVYKHDPKGRLTTGFIAQELYEIFPYAVTTNGDNGISPLSGSTNPWSVDYGRVTPLIVKSVQDLNLDLQALLIGDPSASSTFAFLLEEEDTIWNRLTTIAQGFVDGVLTLAGVTTDELCLKDEQGLTCIDRGELEALIGAANSGSSSLVDTEEEEDDEDMEEAVENLPEDDADETSTSTPEVTEEIPEGDEPIVDGGEEESAEVVEDESEDIQEPEEETVTANEDLESIE